MLVKEKLVLTSYLGTLIPRIVSLDINCIKERLYVVIVYHELK
jgi:hypothetical protein